VGATRPQTRFSYSSLQAYFKVSGSSIVASGEPVTLLTGTSTCQTGATCTGAADQVKTTVSYGPQVTGTGNNLLPVSVSKGAGNNSLTATTAIADRDVFRQMQRAWTMSFGHAGRPGVHEHGFWIGQRGSDYYARGIQEARTTRPRSIILGPSFGTEIWFHTHPFINRWYGISSADASTARVRDILTIAYSHRGFYAYDARD